MRRLPTLTSGIPLVRGVARFAVVGTCLLTGCFSPGADITGSSSSGGATLVTTGTSSTGTSTTVVTTGGPSVTTTSGPTSTSTGETTDALTTGPGTSTTDATTGGTGTTTGTSGTTGSDSSSGGPVVGCGDMVVGLLEECDDGNLTPGDGCSPECEFEYRIVFVSSATYLGKELGGVVGADVKCKKLAEAQPELAGRTFAAWLSTALTDAESRIGFTDREYRLTDKKTKIADNTVDLLDGSLQAAISLDEKAAPAIGPTQVWTGTKSIGIAAANHCSGWSMAGVVGLTGDRTLVDGGWTEGTEMACNELQPIYCIEKSP